MANSHSQAFINNMLPAVRQQISQGFGFGVVVEGAGDQNLLQEGLSAVFYYWVERIGGPAYGAETPNTKEAKGPSNNNPNRHDELSIITGIYHESNSFSTKSDGHSTLRSNTTQPPSQHKSMKTSNFSVGRQQKDDGEDCPPYNNGLFTSLYDINLLTSSSRNDDYPDIIYSQNEKYFLIMQNDCNLVLYTSDKEPIWACGGPCYNRGRQCFARINLDGTLAVYAGDGYNLYYTPSQCSGGPGCWSDTNLVVQDDGNLVLYILETGVAIWATNTNT